MKRVLQAREFHAIFFKDQPRYQMQFKLETKDIAANISNGQRLQMRRCGTEDFVPNGPLLGQSSHFQKGIFKLESK